MKGADTTKMDRSNSGDHLITNNISVRNVQSERSLKFEMTMAQMSNEVVGIFTGGSRQITVELIRPEIGSHCSQR